MCKYSGSKLSDVPFEEIIIGMEIISATNTPGKVTDKIIQDISKSEDNDILIDWQNGNKSIAWHFQLNNVTVK